MATEPHIKLLALLIALCLPMTFAHLSLSSPPPFRYRDNPNAAGEVDYDIKSPISASEFPCKLYAASDIGTSYGASVATYTRGQTYNIAIQGSAIHGGGSCQISLSPYNSPPTRDSFRVIKSMIGRCPTSEGQSFSFKVPEDAPVGPAVLSWTWFNRIGNREMYMSCASVTITKGSSASGGQVSWDSRPKIFAANVGNGCVTIEGVDVVFPDPGPDTVVLGTTINGPKGYTGNCGSNGATYDKPTKDEPKTSGARVLSTPIKSTVNKLAASMSKLSKALLEAKRR